MDCKTFFKFQYILTFNMICFKQTSTFITYKNYNATLTINRQGPNYYTVD